MLPAVHLYFCSIHRIPKTLLDFKNDSDEHQGLKSVGGECLLAGKHPDKMAGSLHENSTAKHLGVQRRVRLCPQEPFECRSSADPHRKLIELAGPFAMQIGHLHNPFAAVSKYHLPTALHGNDRTAIHQRESAFRKNNFDRRLLAVPKKRCAGGLSGAKLLALKTLPEDS